MQCGHCFCLSCIQQFITCDGLMYNCGLCERMYYQPPIFSLNMSNLAQHYSNESADNSELTDFFSNVFDNEDIVTAVDNDTGE